MELYLGAALGGLIAFAFSVPAILLEVMERGKVKQLPLLVDVKTIFNRKLHKYEVFLVAVLLHVLIGMLYGLAYVVFALHGWMFITGAPYTLLSFIVFALLSFLFTGLILFPLLQMGLFGRKEGRYVWAEMLVSFLLLGLTMWLAIHLYQPVYFVA
jgi:hypothetical protein